MRRLGQLPALLAAVLVATGLSVAPAAQAATVTPAVARAAVRPSDDSGPAAHHDTSPPLRTLRATPVGKQRSHPALEVPHPSAAKVTDRVVQKRRGARAAAVPAITSFDGIGSNNYNVQFVPPDPNASVGTTQIVETVNTAFAVFSKTGATVMPPTSTNTVWAGFGGPCETTNDGDAVVRWDTLASRWVITQFANADSTTGPFYECVALSTSANATGTYNRYAFSYTDFNDYPKLSVWPDAYYVTYNMFNAAKTVFLGAKVCALDRAQMLTGAAATQQCFDTDADHGGILGADLDGSTPPPAGAPNVVVGLDSNSTLAYWKFHVDWANPGNSTFTGPATLAVSPYTVACSSDPGLVCVPQGGTNQQLDSLSDRLMYRLAYRNFGDHESLVVNHSVTAGTSSGVRWYELRLAGGNPTVYQQGTYAPDATYRWMGSAAQDRVGNMALGYSQSSGTTSPSIRFTGRQAGDPLGTLPLGETTVLTGAGSQTGSLRWGDYTSMAVDPSDDCTLWYTNQYQPANGTFNWHTRIASLVLPGCVNDFSLSVNPASATVAAGTTATTTVSTAVTSGFPESVSLSASGLPAGASVSFSPNPVTSGGSSTMSVSTSASTPAGTYTITLTGTGASATHSTDFALTVTAPTAHRTLLTATPAFVKKYPYPLLVRPYPTATLTDLDTGRRLAGQRVTFTAGTTVLCTVTTDAKGRATCKPKDGARAILSNNGYTVTYDGDQAHQPATANGRLVIVGKRHNRK
ncbi:hypothetical protein [Streptomyces sp. NPDC046197]|uniref:COG1470 family protein n=1 Tax=Streptomyces sp. NPDC046197 TaxID=3154337 RepID=UPI0033E111BD